MDVSVPSDQRSAVPPLPHRRWVDLGHRLLTALASAGASTVPGGWGPGPWDECWSGRWDGWWDPAAHLAPPARSGELPDR